jgi:hypothetical protein
MSDEYLFQKEGSDREIEKLEDLLSVYRIEPAVPKLSRSEFAPKRNVGFGWFRLSYAVAFATFAFVLVIGGIYLRYLPSPNTEVTAVSAIETPAVDRDVLVSTSIGSASVIAPKTSANDEVPVRPTSSGRNVQTVARHRRRTAANSLVAAKTPRLTKEEKYAYDQLMVALWLTGSKLRVVQDTIDRVNDKPETANEKR